MSLKRRIILFISIISIIVVISFIFTFIFLTKELINSLIKDNLLKGAENFVLFMKRNEDWINSLLNLKRDSSFYYEVLNILDEICGIFKFRYIYIFKPTDQSFVFIIFVFIISNDKNPDINKSNFFWIYYDAPKEM